MDIKKFLMDLVLLGVGSWFGGADYTGSNDLLPSFLKALS